MEKTIQLYCNVDDNGEILQSLWGENIIPEEPFTFFFKVDLETAENIINYKVAVEGFKTKLVLR